jgi:hypothetical protein
MDQTDEFAASLLIARQAARTALSLTFINCRVQFASVSVAWFLGINTSVRAKLGQLDDA